jgi:hypothetical protein
VSVIDLGQPISSHRGSFLAGGWAWYVGALLVLSSVAWAFQFLKALVSGDGHGFEQLAMGLSAITVGLLFLIAPVMRLMQSVQVFERGLVWKRLVGTKTLRRDEVVGAELIIHRSRSGMREQVLVHLEGERTESIVGIQGAEQIVSFLRAWAQTSGSPVTAAGGRTPPSAGGWTPPAGGWTPPSGGGAPPGGAPPAGGGWTPPS